jgi:hypothetical protein
MAKLEAAGSLDAVHLAPQHRTLLCHLMQGSQQQAHAASATHKAASATRRSFLQIQCVGLTKIPDESQS